MHLDQLLTQAIQFLDRNQPLEAANLYRLAAESGLLPRGALVNWSAAEHSAHLSLLEQMGRRYPDAQHCQLQLANYLLHMRRGREAAQCCTQLMERFPERRMDVETRLVRLRAELSSAAEFDHVVEDFLEVWHGQCSVEALRRFRLALLRDISAISNSDLIPTLEQLARDEGIAKEIGGLLSAKLDELAQLVMATQAVNRGLGKEPSSPAQSRD